MVNKEKIISQLSKIFELELSGVVRYLHYSLVVRGPHRLPIVQFFDAQSKESLLHANIIGTKIVSCGGEPPLTKTAIIGAKSQDVFDLLKESLIFEKNVILMYRDLLNLVQDDIALEELCRTMIRTEIEHVEEIEKMIGGS